jgi:putative chitinase
VQLIPDAPASSDGYQAITAAQLCSIVPSVPVSKANEFADALNNAMREFSINTPLRQCAFIAQTAHESMGYTAFLENLNYSANALIATWPLRFTKEIAASYARQPQKIANRAYANRIGNGDEASGDGWKYRGRGIIQITGKDNYKACGKVLNLDLVSSPELLEQTLNAFRSGTWFWNSRNLNPLADRDDFTAITKAINGGLNGLADRLKYYARAKSVIGVVK